MVKKPTKQAVPNILPREPLTKKARAAIECYALHKCGDMRIYSFLIDHTLKAERMRRSDLYEFLEGHGYRWNKYSWKGVKNNE